METEAMSRCASTCGCGAEAVIVGTHWNTLTYDSRLCIGCQMCITVCPHQVFEMNGRMAELVRPEACMECGACQNNCPTGAIQVDSGVGCAAAMIRAALTGGEPTCGESTKKSSCGCGSDSSGCCS